MATVEELKRLKKRKKAEVKAKGGPKGGKPMGGAGQDYVTTGKGDLTRKDYVEILEYEIKGPKGMIIKRPSKKDGPREWALQLYREKPMDRKTGKRLNDVNHMMWTDKKIYKTSPEKIGQRGSGKADELRV